MPEAELISKAEFGRRVGVSASMVGKYVRKGMPVTATGGLNWHEAKRWRDEYVVPELSGSFYARQRKRAEQQTAPQIARSARDLFDTLAPNSGRIPELLIRMGLKDIDLAQVAADVFVSLILHLSDGIDDEAYPDPDELPGVAEIDYEVLAIIYDLPPPSQKRVDRFFNAVDDVFTTKEN
jgi:hypothetical protein